MTRSWKNYMITLGGLRPNTPEEDEWEIWMAHSWPQHFNIAAPYKYAIQIATVALAGIATEAQIERTATSAAEMVQRKMDSHRLDQNHPLVELADFIDYTARCVDAASEAVLLGV